MVAGYDAPVCRDVMGSTKMHFLGQAPGVQQSGNGGATMLRIVRLTVTCRLPENAQPAWK